MAWYHPKSLLDKFFEGGVVLKGVDGVLEFIGGLLLLFISPANMDKFASWLTQKELLEDPHDKIANGLLHLVHILNGTSRTFLITYLWIHAAIKLIAVVGLLRNLLWAFPFSLATLGLFELYQFYLLYVKFSIGIVLLSSFDAFILWLIWREYAKVRAAPADDGQSET